MPCATDPFHRNNNILLDKKKCTIKTSTLPSLVSKPTSLSSLNISQEPHLYFIVDFKSMYDAECTKRGLRWVPAARNFIPAEAIQGGIDVDSQPLYIARGAYEGCMYPGKAGPHLSSGCVIVADQRAISIEKYEVLCGSPNSVFWTTVEGGNMADQESKPFVKAGHDLEGSPYFVARTDFGGSQQIGWCRSDTSVEMFFGFSGSEATSDQYEVLTFC